MFARRAEIILVIGALWVCCYVDATSVPSLVDAHAVDAHAVDVHTVDVHTVDVHTADVHTPDAHTPDAHAADAHAADAHVADVNASASEVDMTGMNATGVNAANVNATGRIHAMYKHRRMGDERSKRRSVPGIVDAHGDSINVSREVSIFV